MPLKLWSPPLRISHCSHSHLLCCSSSAESRDENLYPGHPNYLQCSASLIDEERLFVGQLASDHVTWRRHRIAPALMRSRYVELFPFVNLRGIDDAVIDDLPIVIDSKASLALLRPPRQMDQEVKLISISSCRSWHIVTSLFSTSSV